MSHRIIWLSLVLALGACVSATRAPISGGDPQDVEAIHDLLDEIYASVSFDRGGAPGWNRLRAQLMEGATFVQPVRGRVVLQSTGEFIDDFKSQIRGSTIYDDGFYERVAGRQTFVFGNVAQSVVVFETRRARRDHPDVRRGVDLFHLVKQDGTWRVSSVATERERPGQPIPPQLVTEDES